jgi:hypothetical protein
MLNELSIEWKREGCFKYDNRNYFPDFHLIKSDIYLDIKNEYLIKIDAAKIQKVRDQNPEIKLLVFTLSEMSDILKKVGA